MGGRYDYYNKDNIGKFIDFCEDNGLDVDDIEEELDDPNNCMYVEFDGDDFPFPDNLKDKDTESLNSEIFQILKECYHTGLPPDKYRPRKKNLTRKKTSTILVDAYLRDISKQCKGTDGKPVVV